MPLCPQVTITPVTVTSSNMTVASVIAGNVSPTYEQLSEVDAAAQQALADAAAAQADATTAIADANQAITDAAAAQTDAAAALAAASTAYDTAVAANTAASTAQTTANGKNKVTYSTAAPGTTANTAGDIWYQYGTTSPNVGRIIGQWIGAGGTSWTSTTISGLVVANLDAGSITAGTLSVGIGITGPTNSFSVNAVSGVMTATGVNVTGTITATTGTFTGTVVATTGTFTGTVIATTGTFTGTVIATTGTFTGTVTATTGSFTGSIFSTNGTIGGWSISSSGISKTVGTKTMTLDSANAILTITDTSTGILSGGGINITSGGTTGTYGAGGLSFGGSVAVSLNNGDLYLQGGATSQIRLSPGAGLGSTTYWVQVEGHLNTAAYSLSAGTWSSSSTSLTAGTYISATGAIIARRDNQIPFFANKYNATGTTEMIRLIYNGSDAGGITTTAGGVPAFRNASDYRLKSNIADFNGATEIIKGTRLRTFSYNVEPDKLTVGFIAHELAEILPDLVLGEKDAIDEEGNPAYQAITTTNLIPYLAGALKDIILRVETLEQGGN